MWQRGLCVIERIGGDNSAKKHIFMNASLTFNRSKYWFSGSVYKMIEVFHHAWILSETRF
jgi:hypothetical protein